MPEESHVGGKAPGALAVPAAPSQGVALAGSWIGREPVRDAMALEPLCQTPAPDRLVEKQTN